MIYVAALIGLAVVGKLGWDMFARTSYESAEYTVVQSDGNIEIRDYPSLMLAATETRMDSQGNDGSFMRLFRYIGGANEADKKIAMTTPVFVEMEDDNTSGSMGFVLPAKLAKEGVPEPTSEGVRIRKRAGGQFAVIRFSGRLNSKSACKYETRLRDWLDANGLAGEENAEAAGYDPPFIPGPLRRNEVLIRLASQ